MRHYLLCCCVLALANISTASGQEVIEEWDQSSYDDYEAYFGRQQPRKAGPASLDEARKQRRGFRIGQRRALTGQPIERKEGEVHSVVEGDTLWGICESRLGDPMQWPKVWSYNPEVTNPHWIYPGTDIHLSAASASQEPPSTDVDGAPVAASPTKGAAVSLSSQRVVVVKDDDLKLGELLLRDQGYLDREALKTEGKITGAPEEQMVLATSDQVYITFKSDSVVESGAEYAVFRNADDWERSPNERGRLVKIMGTVVVRSYDRQKRVARAVITEAMAGIERGARVAKVQRRFDLVSPTPNRTNVVARIVAATKPRALLSYGDVVFLDVGTNKGVEPGNRFFVVRRGDEFLEGIQGRETEVGSLMKPPTYRPKQMPKEVIAELRVVKVRKETTVAYVTRSDTDLTFGDVAEMRVGY